MDVLFIQFSDKCWCRFFSVDFGLVHLVALDLNMYFGTDDCGDACKQAQMAWLKQDLAKANSNRDQVPWVVAMSHFPFYCTGCQGANNIVSVWMTLIVLFLCEELRSDELIVR